MPGSLVDVVPDLAGFEHVALPGYHNARTFLAARELLARTLGNAIAAADVVQLDHGGHPIPLGVIADPIARHLQRRRIWTIAGDKLPDPRLAHAARTTARRLIGRPVDARVRRVWAEALRTADGILTQSASVTRDLHRTLAIGSTSIESINALDADLATAGTLAVRQERLLDTDRPLRLVVSGDQSIARGTDHVLRAMARVRRLHVPLELIVIGRGTEIAPFARLAGELGLASAVSFCDDANAVAEADVLVDASLTDRSQPDLARALAGGLAPIAYAPRIDCEGLVAVPRNDLDALTAALFNAALRRDALVARMLRGVAWASARTLDVGHRRRIELALGIIRRNSRGAA